MREELLELIVRPECGLDLRLQNARWSAAEVESGELVCAGVHSHPIRMFVPRFVSEDDYADAFALERK